MESIKEKLSGWLEGFQNYINSFTVIEKQNKIFYFSKYSLILSEFYQIYNFVKTLKENIFRTLIEQFKYCVKDIILFKKNLTQKEKVIILYSSCLLIYYKKFCFDTNNSFEEYYDNDFIYISYTNFGYQIINQELFKIFIFYYYSEIKKQIKSLDYNIIKNLKKYYNYKENVNNKENDINKNENIKHKNYSEQSTINSINNDYFPDPNILLVKNKTNINKKDFKPNIFSGRDIKLKKIKTDNLRLYIGCEQDKTNINKCKNVFKGFIGDIFIFNKNLRDNTNNKIELEKLLLYLGGNYSSIFFNYLENKKDGNFFFNSNYKYLKEFYNSNFTYLKEKIKDLNDNNIKFDSITAFINPNFFKLIEYHDSIDYMNYINNDMIIMEKKIKIILK